MTIQFALQPCRPSLLFGCCVITQATILPGPIGENEHTNEELVHVLRAKGCQLSPRLEAALLLVPRDLFVPRDRHREAFR